MPNGIRLPRRDQHLPVELVQRNSDLDVMITLSGDSTEKRTFGFESTAKTVRRLIGQNCSSYRPSTDHENDVLCRSGEDDGNPTRGALCFTCRAGQFSRNGVFIGEMTSDGTAQYPNAADPVVVSQDGMGLYDLIKALEKA